MFYTEKRDGFARLGVLEINGLSIRTPAMLEGDILKKIDFGKAPYAVKKILPEVYEKLKPKGEIEILTGLPTMSPREIADAFSELRSVKPLFAVACADPKNVSLLIHLGADLVDNVMAVAKAYRGIYFLNDLEVKIEKLKAFPCNCKFCKSQELSKLSKDEILEITALHNTEELKREVEKCKILIEEEDLRNYVEAKAKLNPEFTALLRFADLEESPCFPRFRRSTCFFNSQESIGRFEV
ncbi:MAG: hypothetical protein QXQ38_02690, partial [Archaeoglobaceae archaeon]